MELQNVIRHIVRDTDLHSRWLNTLSLMENTGARKISASEHKTEVSLIILKHAAEEHRHAYYLKKQISKLSESCSTYADQFLLAPHDSRFYLNKLDVEVCKYLKTELGLVGQQLKFGAYLLVTYAIEVRADELYPVYQEVLEEMKSRVNVKSIILEEEGHLEEMLAQLKNFSREWEQHAGKAVQIESHLFKSWINALANELVAVN